VTSTYLHNLANSYKNLGDTEAALKHYNKSLKIKQMYEKRDLMPHTYAMIGNVYLSTGKYTKAITPFSSALAIFQDIGNSKNEGLVLLNLTELFINIGKLDEAKKLIADAEKILSDFQDPTIAGYLSYYKGNIAFQKLEISKAIQHIGDSIEQFQITQKQQEAYKRYLLLVQILLYDQQYHKADICLNKINPLEKQVRDVEDVLLADCLRLFIRAIQNDLSPSEGDKILKNLQGPNHNNDCHLTWWYLALLFSMIGENNKSKRCLKESKKMLSNKVAKITDKSHRDGFINENIIHQQIMNLNDKSLTDLTNSFNKQSNIGGMSKFCAECGYANKDMNLFCPECGYDLQMD
jgi:tetratricopeptide (TPR) repeat protein